MQNTVGAPVQGENLFGRAYELSQIRAILGRGDHIMMLGPRRVGKTSLMFELRRDPQPNWDVLYVDVESGDSAADCVAAIIAGLAKMPAYRTWLEVIPFGQSLRSVFSKLSVGVSYEALKIEIKRAMTGNWQDAADELIGRLAQLPDPKRRLLIMVDELPLVFSRLLLLPDGRKEAELLLSRLRTMRQAPALARRVQFLFGGSIGLEGVLRRANLSGLISDLASIQVGAWDHPTAREFLLLLGADSKFVLNDDHIEQILGLLVDAVPYHVQLFFSLLGEVCRGDPGKISESTITRCFEDRLCGPNGTAHLDHYAGRLEIALSAEEHALAWPILAEASRSPDGTAIEGLEQSDDPLFPNVIRVLEADGYLERSGNRVRFRSNYVRAWWRRYHAATEVA